MSSANTGHERGNVRGRCQFLSKTKKYGKWSMRQVCRYLYYSVKKITDEVSSYKKCSCII